MDARNTHTDSDFHGPDHWRCVAWTGLHLIRETRGCDPAVVFLFALFHDSQRWNDGHDPEHGRRGGALAAALRGVHFQIGDEQAAVLADACNRHTGAPPTDDPTRGVCWDSDRLNLWRVYKTPAARFLSTEAAKRRIEWAREVHRMRFTWQDLYARYQALDG